jgi:hypothetical protein
MKKLNPIEYLTGFLMGFFFVAFIEIIFLVIFRMLWNLFGWNRPVPAWWMLILLIAIPLLSGLNMGKTIASMHLEDY